MGTKHSFPGGKAARVLNTQLHLALWLRMGGATPLLPLYAIMTCTGTTLPLSLNDL